MTKNYALPGANTLCDYSLKPDSGDTVTGRLAQGPSLRTRLVECRTNGCARRFLRTG
jgi:hypothetical protein